MTTNASLLPNHKGGPYINESCAQFPIALQLKTHRKIKLSQAKYGTGCRKTKCIMFHYKLKKGENYLMHMD